MYRKILVAYDGSKPAEHAIDAAIEMLEHGVSKKLLVVSVSSVEGDDPAYEAASRMAGVVEEDYATDGESPREELKGALADKLGAFKDATEFMALRGKPRSVIAQIAADNDCDIIIMGRRGMSAFRAMMESVSESVLRNTDLPVLLVK